MQPFDGDVYDKRYETVFAPGINDAGLEPYRVDRDPGVSVPVDSIESGIRGAQLCFADITTDNPNVWFELGFAIAASKEVVLVCSEERKTHFPFDVQHRSIIRYRAGAPQDFVELRESISERIKAVLEKQGKIARASSISPVKNTEGLSQHEVVALVTVMQNQFVMGGPVTALAIRRDMNQAGFTDIAVSLAVRVLQSKNMLMTEVGEDERGERYSGFVVTKDGDAWLMSNQDLFVTQLRDDVPF